MKVKCCPELRVLRALGLPELALMRDVINATPMRLFSGRLERTNMDEICLCRMHVDTERKTNAILTELIGT